MRVPAKNVKKHGKEFIPSTGNDYLDGAIYIAADVAENQMIGADPNTCTSLKERLEMAGDDILSGVAEEINYPIVDMAAKVAKVKYSVYHFTK